MERKRRIKGPDGQAIDATEVGFRGTGEYWNEYLLDDGTVVKLKVVTTNMYRIDGQYADDGEPLYLVKSNNVMTVSAPDELRKPEE